MKFRQESGSMAYAAERIAEGTVDRFARLEPDVELVPEPRHESTHSPQATQRSSRTYRGCLRILTRKSPGVALAGATSAW